MSAMDRVRHRATVMDALRNEPKETPLPVRLRKMADLQEAAGNVPCAHILREAATALDRK